MGKISTTYSPLNSEDVNLRYQTVIVEDADLTAGDYFCANTWTIYVFKTTVPVVAYLPTGVPNDEKVFIKHLGTQSITPGTNDGTFINLPFTVGYPGIQKLGAVEFVKKDGYWYSLEERETQPTLLLNFIDVEPFIYIAPYDLVINPSYDNPGGLVVTFLVDGLPHTLGTLITKYSELTVTVDTPGFIHLFIDKA